MCGYFGYRQQGEAIAEVMDALAIDHYATGPRLLRRSIEGLVTLENRQIQVSPTFWWFAHKKTNGQYVPDWNYTTFNARNLDSRYWQRFANNRRGIFFASEFGESNLENNQTVRRLMRAEAGLILGAIYNDWHNDDGTTTRSTAIITRDPHSRFKHYHEKSTPLLLPAEPDIIHHWLNPEIKLDDPLI